MKVKFISTKRVQFIIVQVAVQVILRGAGYKFAVQV